jgi:flagellar basal-body rod protein FlgB
MVSPARVLALRQDSDAPTPPFPAIFQSVINGPSIALFGCGMHVDLGAYLSYLTRRQEAVASNIANADTPGYKTRDVGMPGDFSTAFAQLTAMPEETPGLVSRNDGNNVSIDRESRLLAENDIRFNLATQLLRGEIRTYKMAIEEGSNS